MKKSACARLIFISIFLLFEALSFYHYKNASREMLFFVWAFVYLALFISKFFKGRNTFPTQGLSSGDDSRYLFMSMSFNRLLNREPKDSRPIVKATYMDLIFLVLFLINLVLSILCS